MTNLKQIQNLVRLHNSIKNENTGSPKEIAQNFHLSERMIYNLIEKLKDYNAPIKYSRRARTYYYLNDFDLEVNISVKAITDDEVFKILGGKIKDPIIMNRPYLNPVSVIRKIY